MSVIRITLKKSLIGRLASHKACVAGLGLKRVRQTVEVADTAANRGMLKKINYLVSSES